MTRDNQAIIEAPGETCILAQPTVPEQVVTANIAHSVALPFEKVKHLLSDRPLRRPNRNKPLDS